MAEGVLGRGDVRTDTVRGEGTGAQRSCEELGARDGTEENEPESCVGVPGWGPVTAALQNQEGPPPTFGGILDTETDDATHWPRGCGTACGGRSGFQWGPCPGWDLLRLGVGQVSTPIQWPQRREHPGFASSGPRCGADGDALTIKTRTLTVYSNGTPKSPGPGDELPARGRGTVEGSLPLPEDTAWEGLLVCIPEQEECHGQAGQGGTLVGRSRGLSPQ